MRNFKNIFIPSAVLVIICLVISAALAYTNDLTHEKIAEIDRQNEIKSMSQIFPDEGIDFVEKNCTLDGSEYKYCEAVKDNAVIGYIFTVANNGYGGKVGVMTGVNADGTVKAIRVLSVDDETPGLGQTAKDNTSFAKQFEGKSGSISESKNADVDALTGATITTTAVIKDVNTALDLYNKVKG